LDNIILSIEKVYYYLLVANILMSWVPGIRDSQVGYWIRLVTEPYLSIFRRFIPPIGGTLDISPIAAFLVYNFAVYYGLNSLLGIS
jgi:YggT family protein